MRNKLDFFLGIATTLLTISFLIGITMTGRPERGSGRQPVPGFIYATDSEDPTSPGEGRKEPRPKVANND